MDRREGQGIGTLSVTYALGRLDGVVPAEVRRQTTLILSPREIDVGRLAVLGVPTRQIAERLYISENTVKTHLRNVYRKTAAANRADLLRKLIVPPGGPSS